MLAGRRFGFAFSIKSTYAALELQVGTFAARELARGSNISSHSIKSSALALNATLLRRTTAIVWNGRHVGDVVYLVTTGIKSANSRLAAGAGAFDFNVKVLKSVFFRRFTSAFGRN